jgi:hypothetical protein
MSATIYMQSTLKYLANSGAITPEQIGELASQGELKQTMVDDINYLCIEDEAITNADIIEDDLEIY